MFVVGILIRSSVLARCVTLGRLLPDQLVVDGFGGFVIHRAADLRPSVESRTPPAVGEVDDKQPAGRFKAGLITLVRGAFAAIQRRALTSFSDCDCVHGDPFVSWFLADDATERDRPSAEVNQAAGSVGQLP